LTVKESFAELQYENDQLKQENYRLRQINDALIERVEATGGQRSDPYAAFEHSVVLAEQVRERTEALNEALKELKHSNRALSQATTTAETAHNRLIDAIESISDAFVLFDQDRCMVLSNSRFRSFWQGTGIELEPGISIEQLKDLARQHGLVDNLDNGAANGREFRLSNGRWIQLSERATRDGGLVMLYTDITKLKEREEAKREAALASKSKLLQSTVDHLSQGVVLINPKGELELWNDRFAELAQLSPEHCLGELTFQEICRDKNWLSASTGASEQFLNDGRVLEVKAHPVASGGVVNTYTDITERHRYAETLRESEQWIRLITDNVPALIAYMGADLRYQFTNKVYDEWYGWPRGELIGKDIRLVHGADRFKQLQPYIEQALEGDSVTFEIEELNLLRQQRFLLKSYVPNLASDGQVLGFFVMVRDITERRRTAEALQQAYQNMEQRVRERTSELLELNDQLREEIDERIEVEGRLRDAKKEAEQANLSKTKFLAAVSHDLLQPLNAARLFTGALEEKVTGEPLAHLVSSVSHSLHGVEGLLSTLVDISKLDAGVITADITNFPVQQLANNLANEFSQIAESEGVEFSYVPSRCVVKTDSQLLARILRNFLSNAIRYTSAGRVLFGCRRCKEGLRIEVWDTGIGIPQSKLGDIFQEFKRLHPDEAGADKGLGLGLAIVEKISRILNHRVSVSSVEGQGSVFAVTLPYGDQQLLQVQPAISSQGALQQLSGAVIWVIDNDPSICEGMRTLLQGWGAEVITAGSLESLTAQIEDINQPAELLIADYHLDHDETGFDVALRLNQQRTKPLPVLMVTANYSNELKHQALAEGFQLIHKPVKPLKLKMMLSHMLKSG